MRNPKEKPKGLMNDDQDILDATHLDCKGGMGAGKDKQFSPERKKKGREQTEPRWWEDLARE